MENVYTKPERTFLLVACTIQWSWSLLAAQATTESPLKEYCFPGPFNATCGHDEVIMMTAAKYGRMKPSRCLSSDYPMDCHVDVLTQVDGMCSGRQSCSFAIPSTTLHAVLPCAKDLFASLGASYECVKVAALPRGRCRPSQVLKLTQQSGYIASSVTADTNQGSANCPWVIEVPKGQRVNISLLDFGVSQATRFGLGVCQNYAVIMEKNNNGDLTVCSGSVREKVVYISETNSVRVKILSDQSNDPANSAKFLLHYSATGCPDEMRVPFATVKRTGNQMTVRCRYDSRKWHLVCNGKRWVGDVKNCTPAVEPPVIESWNTGEGVVFPYGLLVAVIIGVILGIMLGLTLLAMVMCYQRRRRLANQQRENTYASDSTWRRQQLSTYDTTMSNKTSEYGYSHVWDMRDATTTHSGVHLGTPYTFKQGTDKPEDDRITIRSKEHTYESPNFSSNDSSVRNNNMDVPYYHEFDATIDRDIVALPDNRT